MAGTVYLIVSSLLNRNKPVPVDTAAPAHLDSRPLAQAANKKIA
jgi:hypothetical protein